MNIAQDCKLFKAIKGYAWVGKAIHGGPKWLKFQPKMPRLDTMRYWYLGIYPS